MSTNPNLSTKKGTTMAKKSKSKPLDPKAIRASLKMNQHQFWTRVGVVQSTGSRYETGRSVPKPVETLLAIAYGTDVQAQAAVANLRTQ